jgi:hypothetical protein
VLRPNVPPPPHYYADNLTRLLDTVARQYSDILETPELARLEHVRALGVDALRLYARLLTRKGPLLRADTLRYREVSDTAAALTQLTEAELIHPNPAVPGDLVLAQLTLPEIRAAFPELPAGCRALRKEALVAATAARYPEPELRSRLGGVCAWLLLTDPDWLNAMRILFFGDLRQDFSTFVLEDLGVVRYEQYPLDPAQRLFPTRAELARYLELLRTKREVRRLHRNWHEHQLRGQVEHLWRPESNRLLERQRGRLLNEIGREAERHHAFDLALTAYGRSDREPGRERSARILNRLGDRNGVSQVLKTIEGAPHSAGEQHFAHQFAARTGLAPKRGQRIAELQLHLTNPPADLEAAALTAWLRNGGTGAHLENRFPLGLLGLAFWDIVFMPVPGMFTHPYQSAPLDLYWPDFRRTRAVAIARRFDELRVPGRLGARMHETYRAKYGVSNALMSWSKFPAEFLAQVLRAVPSQHLVAMFDFMLDDLHQTRTGFPDLVMCFGSGSYRLVEVKGPGDQLRREQRLWFELFARVGIPASVLRVSW